jgi:hypothetical protein
MTVKGAGPLDVESEIAAVSVATGSLTGQPIAQHSGSSSTSLVRLIVDSLASGLSSGDHADASAARRTSFRL